MTTKPHVIARVGAGKGTRVIVTRPLAQALPWVDALGALGIDAVALPLIEIEPADDGLPLRAAWHDVPARALVMFVSANAVRHFFLARPIGAQWPAGTLAGSTGPGTSAALRDAGVPPACITEPAAGARLDSESLWDVLRSQDWHGRSALIVRGEDGRDWLADALGAAGAQVDFLAAYRRHAPRLDAAARELLAAACADPAHHRWLISSSEAVRHLQSLTPGADWSAACALVSHPRIAQAARAAGFGDVRIVDAHFSAVAAALASVELPAS